MRARYNAARLARLNVALRLPSPAARSEASTALGKVAARSAAGWGN
jgi:hypothetical protein